MSEPNSIIVYMNPVNAFRPVVFIPIDAYETSEKTRFQALKTTLIDDDLTAFLAFYDLESLSHESLRLLLSEALILNRTAFIPLLIDSLGEDFKHLREKDLSPLILAFYLDDISLAKKLLEKGIPIDGTNKHGDALIHIALRKRRTDWAAWILNEKGNIDAPGRAHLTPLMIAIQENLFLFVDYLIEKGAGLDKRSIAGMTPLFFAVEQGLFHLIPKLAPTPAIVNIPKTDGTTPLMLGCDYRCQKTVSMLISLGADVNLLDMDGESALYKSVNLIDAPTVQVLLNAKANPNIQVKHCKKTPLILAVEKNNPYLVFLLCEAGADLKLSDHLGFTPLHVASEMGHIEAIRMLFNYKPDLNAVSLKGYTPLSAATYFNDEEIIDLLLLEGAKPSILGVDASNAWSLAFKKGFIEIGLKLLLADKSVPTLPLSPYCC